MENKNAKQTVLQFIESLNMENFETARKLEHNDLKFEGVMGTRDGAVAYFTEMARMKFKYDIKNCLADENNVSILFDVNMGSATLLSCGWYHVIDGKIKSIRVIFDPRPLFENKDK